MRELIPCPFCGAAPYLSSGQTKYYVQHHKQCYLYYRLADQGGVQHVCFAADDDAAAMRWNKRWPDGKTDIAGMPPPLSEDKWMRFTLYGQEEPAPCEYYEHVCDPDIIAFRSCATWACLIYRRHLYAIMPKTAPDRNEICGHMNSFRRQFHNCYDNEALIEPEALYAAIKALDGFFRAPVMSMLPNTHND